MRLLGLVLSTPGCTIHQTVKTVLSLSSFLFLTRYSYHFFYYFSKMNRDVPPDSKSNTVINSKLRKQKSQ